MAMCQDWAKYVRTTSIEKILDLNTGEIFTAHEVLCLFCG